MFCQEGERVVRQESRTQSGEVERAFGWESAPGLCSSAGSVPKLSHDLPRLIRLDLWPEELGIGIS